jgi:hypothetical protein
MTESNLYDWVINIWKGGLERTRRAGPLSFDTYSLGQVALQNTTDDLYQHVCPIRCQLTRQGHTRCHSRLRFTQKTTKTSILRRTITYNVDISEVVLLFYVTVKFVVSMESEV